MINAVAASQVPERHHAIYFRVNVYAVPAGDAAAQYAVNTVAPKIGSNAKTLRLRRAYLGM